MKIFDNYKTLEEKKTKTHIITLSKKDDGLSAPLYIVSKMSKTTKHSSSLDSFKNLLSAKIYFSST